MVFVQNRPFFDLFILGNIGQENVFHDIQERKNAFLGYKKKIFKKSNGWHFFKEVSPRHGFGPKLRPIFSSCTSELYSKTTLFPLMSL